MIRDNEFYLDGDIFVIENYDRQKPFASFLPGVAGLNGIPMWVYYTNRGQGISCFGIENKDGAILDFVPANKAYRRTETEGYRTFIKKDGRVHEIFSSASNDDVRRRMLIEFNSVGFIEENFTLGLCIHVKYFTVTDEKYPGLVRKVLIEPLEGFSGNVQVMDGLATLWPFGNNDFAIKNMSNLSVAWFEAYNTDKKIPFFRNRSTTSDSAEVGTIEAGHFHAAFTNKYDDAADIIYDPELVFSTNTALTKPDGFIKMNLGQMLEKEQQSANKIPCAFAIYEGPVGESLVITGITGRMNNIDSLNKTAGIISMDYIDDLEERAKELGESLVAPVAGRTAVPEFDAYIKQSFLDNLLRGGYPIIFNGSEGPMVYHVYSRIHGDMEREYNNFVVEPAYYSQGAGSYRDVNQNRRNDIYFVKEAGLFNVILFMELIQMDGQNPLSIRGSGFRLIGGASKDLMVHLGEGRERIKEILSSEFTPGILIRTLDDYNIDLDIGRDEFLSMIMEKSVQITRSSYGHGYWVDHWTYNMDLIDNYLNIYPDGFSDLLFLRELKYFISPVTVLPRADKYVMNSKGKIRQYDALIENRDRIKKLGLDPGGTNWHRCKDGKIIKTSLFVKLFSLVLNKITSLDQSGIGIMMNTDKPGWNDAMNGLPGLFGSGTSEVIELGRIVELLIKACGFSAEVSIPKELYDFYIRYKGKLMQNLNGDMDDLELFETAQKLKETFNEMISLELSGVFETAAASSFRGFLENVARKIDDSIEKAIKLGDGIPPSYLVHDALEYKVLEGKVHPVNGLQNIIVNKWNLRSLPLYLEAPARYLKQLHDINGAKVIFDKIKESGMYDKKLRMYVTSESLEKETYEIGRARAFSAGWLERESVFMHMEYKYLLGLLKSGLYDEFFEAIKTALPPFMDPSVYGRSILENSSFIASSRNPDPSNHGRGFVSRLTGTTSEAISMWIYMMTGANIFTIVDDCLVFSLKPILPSYFFDENNEVRCRIFEDTEIIYMNPERKPTYGPDCASVKWYTLYHKNGGKKKVEFVLDGDALSIRNKEVKIIEALLM